MRDDAFKDFFCRTFGDLPWPVSVIDWRDRAFHCGGSAAHWTNRPLQLHFRTKAAAEDVWRLNPMAFLERFVRGEAEMEGNLYALPFVKKFANLGKVSVLTSIPSLIKQFAFQSMSRAKANVKSHYDIPQAAVDLYLDKVYKSYSCGIFSRPDDLSASALTRVGAGAADDFDSLELSMWRKFKDASDFIDPKEGETLLDVGCGYGGQLEVALAGHPFGKVVGWTHSKNQVAEAREKLKRFPAERWEALEGDYRNERRVFDHITSTGMVCHVGPRGLNPYLKNVRKLIKTGGRYLHHVIMSTPSRIPFDLQVGPAFNKRYVWPGFHWFTFGTHVKALETHGFQVISARNLAPHYAKTTAAWYERMMAQRDLMVQYAGDPTFRAWRIFLAGISGGFSAKEITIYRIYCEAV